MNTFLSTTFFLLLLLSHQSAAVEASSPQQFPSSQPVQIAKLLPDPVDISHEGAQFGRSVSVSGSQVVVGAPYHSLVQEDSGAVYVYGLDDGGWVFTQKLEHPDQQQEAYFGHAVKLMGDVLLVGAYGDNTRGFNAGALFVYHFDGSSWVFSQKITANDAGPNDWFGYSVDVGGSHLLVGALGVNDSGFRSGAVYAYAHDGSTWQQTQRLVSPNADEYGSFGDDLSLDGDRLVVGAYGESSFSGRAYVYDYNGVTWAFTQQLRASDGRGWDYFGGSVSLQGDQVLVGASGTDNAGPQTGSVYAFDFDGMQWLQSQKISIGASSSPRYFGGAVSLTGQRALVGARDSGVAGAVYLYEYDGLAWQYQNQFTSDDGSGSDSFGANLNVSDGLIVVGAYGDDDLGVSSGAAYLFDLDPHYAVKTAVTGLAGGSLELFNGTDSVVLTADGVYTLSVLADGSVFDVDIGNQPTMPNQTCQFTSADSGVLAGSDVVVEVGCVTTQYQVGLQVTGLLGDGVGFINGNDVLTVSENGLHVLSVLDDGSDYAVSITGQPTSPNQLCSFTSAHDGQLGGADVVIEVACETVQYAIGAEVTGLSAGNVMTLQNNGGDDLIVTANGSVEFAALVDDGGSYSVTVSDQPEGPNQTCEVSLGAGTVNGSDVSDVGVHCIINQYFIGGSVTGLYPGNLLLLQNNGSDDLFVSTDGVFVFAEPMDDGSSYAVTIPVQPDDPMQPCAVIEGDGQLSGIDVVDVQVHCEPGSDLIYRHGFDHP